MSLASTRVAPRRRTTIISLAASAVVAIGGITAPTASAAPSSASGLYGTADPTYDGVYRQSLGLMGLVAVGRTPDASAITWLLDQQCKDGSFQAYRADLAEPCGTPDPENYSGPDLNSTAMAYMSLMSLDDSRLNLPNRLTNRIVDAVEASLEYLTANQLSNGGWPYYAGGAADANSTGLAAAALRTLDFQFRPQLAKASRFLGRLSGACSAGGGFAYQAGNVVDPMASAQGTLGIVGSLPVERKLPKAAAAAPCANTAKAKGLSYLNTGLSTTGLLPSAYGDGPDYQSTAFAVLDLAQARQGRTAIAKGTSALAANAKDFVSGSGATSPAAAGLLLMVAEATGRSPKAFGGMNLISTLTSSMRR